MNAKICVQVNADFNPDGLMLPRELIWEDGEKYTMDRIIEIQQVTTMKAGGQGDRYTIEVHGHKSYLFLSEVLI